MIFENKCFWSKSVSLIIHHQVQDFKDKNKKTVMSWRTRFGPKPVAFILGNEGGDMDSVVCAFMMSKLIVKASSNNNNNNMNNHHAPWLQKLQNHSCVPVCNFAKSELSLRQDIILAFEKCHLAITNNIENRTSSNSNSNSNLSPAFFTFADELPFMTSKSAESMEILTKHNDCIILVDHNVPCPSQMHLCPFVQGIVDHHALPPEPIKFSNHHQEPSLNINLVETIGSAASLVARLFMQMKIELQPGEAQLLLSPILMDTHNFNPASKKAVAGDFEARDFLIHHLMTTIELSKEGDSSSEVFCKNLFVELADARESYERLTISDALKKDTKLFQFALAASSSSSSSKLLSMPIASWSENLEKHVLKRFKMSELLDELIKFCEERGGEDTDGSMAMFFKDGQRHLIFFAKTETCQKAMKSFFEFHKTESPTFTNLTESMIRNENNNECDYDTKKYSKDQFGVYLFDDASISRKQLTPKLTDFLLKFSA